jgi:hypothetical protein
MTITSFARSIGPLRQVSFPGWRVVFGRCTEENHTLYSDGRIHWGAPYRRMISVYFFGFTVGVTQLRKKPAPIARDGL